MKFKVIVRDKNGKTRIGKLFNAERLPEIEFETPLLTLYTKGGSIPHITHEVLQLLTNECQTILVPLVSTVQFIQPLGSWDRPLADFVGLTEHLTCVSVQDPGDLTPAGKHKQESIPIWTRSGKIDITAEKYMNMIETFKPDIYCSLSDGDTNVSSPKKRIQKSVDRTLQLFEKCYQRHINSNILKNKMFLGAISGGFSISERERCIRSLSRNEYDQLGGFLIDGLHNNGPELELINFQDVEPVVQRIVELLPADKLRAVYGCWNPLAILELVRLGVDMFDSSFPYIATERSAALTFNYIIDDTIVEKFEINLRDSVYATSFEPIYTNCQCLACRKHSRAYICHLLNVQELLGTVLLTIHNLHHYLTFFKQIRLAIRNDQLEHLYLWIKKQYEEYQTSLLEKKSITDVVQSSELHDEGDTIYNFSTQVINV